MLKCFLPSVQEGSICLLLSEDNLFHQAEFIMKWVGKKVLQISTIFVIVQPYKKCQCRNLLEFTFMKYCTNYGFCLMIFLSSVFCSNYLICPKDLKMWYLLQVPGIFDCLLVVCFFFYLYLHLIWFIEYKLCLDYRVCLWPVAIHSSLPSIWLLSCILCTLPNFIYYMPPVA